MVNIALISWLCIKNLIHINTTHISKFFLGSKQDFSSLNKFTISLEDMEKKVMEVLANERKAFGIRDKQS